MRGDATKTSTRIVAQTNTTSHAPLALEMRVEILTGRDGQWAGLVIETGAPVIVALKD